MLGEKETNGCKVDEIVNKFWTLAQSVANGFAFRKEHND